MDTSPKSEPTLEQISTAAPSVEANHRSVGPDAGRNSKGRWIIKKKTLSSQLSPSGDTSRARQPTKEIPSEVRVDLINFKVVKCTAKFDNFLQTRPERKLIFSKTR